MVFKLLQRVRTVNIMDIKMKMTINIIILMHVSIHEQEVILEILFSDYTCLMHNLFPTSQQMLKNSTMLIPIVRQVPASDLTATYIYMYS